METEAKYKVSSEQPDLDEVTEKIFEIMKKSTDGDYIYRGEPEHYEDPPYYGRVTSGLYRSFLERGQKHVNVGGIQQQILNEARDYLPGKIDDLELLATLQYYGDKTNLIDFTNDYLIALFFACDGKPGKPGRVILLPKESEDKDDGYDVEKPFGTIRRAASQKSIFVIASQGFVTPNEDKVVCIPANLKLALLDYLDKYHDISTKTIYNDLHGFIEKRRLHEEAYTEFNKGFTSQDRAGAAKTKKERQKLYEDAIVHYTEAIDLKPDLIEAYYNRGLAYAAKSDFDAAIEDYSKAIDLVPEDADVYTNRGLAYAAKSDFDAAIEDYSKAIDLVPEDADVYTNRGLAYAAKSDFDAAIEDYSKAIDLVPEDADVYTNRGLAYAAKSDFDAAIEDYSKAINLAPEDAGAYYNRGEAWLHRKEWQKAKADLTTAKDMGWDIIESFQNDYESVEDFEAKNGVTLPKDIAALLSGNTT